MTDELEDPSELDAIDRLAKALLTKVVGRPQSTKRLDAVIAVEGIMESVYQTRITLGRLLRWEHE